MTILEREARVDELPLLSKREVADRILDRVARALDARDAAAQTVISRDMSATERTSRRLTIADIGRMYADERAHPDADGVRLPDRPDPRRRRHADDPRRRLAGPGRLGYETTVA